FPGSTGNLPVPLGDPPSGMEIRFLLQPRVFFKTDSRQERGRLVRANSDVTQVSRLPSQPRLQQPSHAPIPCSPNQGCRPPWGFLSVKSFGALIRLVALRAGGRGVGASSGGR